MASIPVETAVEIVTVLGGTIALLLALLQIVETYLDIGEKLRKLRLAKKKKEKEVLRGARKPKMDI